MLKIFILLAFLEIIYTAEVCKEGENYCTTCNHLTNKCIECEMDILELDKNGICVLIQKCQTGKNYCKECNTAKTLCKTCDTGYFADEIGGCSISGNCELSYRGKCLICKEDFVLVGGDSIKICKSLESEDLQNCDQIDYTTGYCTKCKEGFFLNSMDKKCTKIEHCSESLIGKCVSCNDNYYLDQTDGRKCKSQLDNSTFLHCIETEDGETCSKCAKNYFPDEEKGNCVSTNHCSSSKNFRCEECIEDYYLIKDSKICVNTENCKSGDKVTGNCDVCKYGYYYDANDGMCKSNKEDDDLKFCKYFSDKCYSCEENYYLSEDDKCSSSVNCAKSENGICQKCTKNLFLDKNHKCTRIEHCIYSTLFSCEECEDGYYYGKGSGKCFEAELEKFENCKRSDIYEIKCEECKDDFYLYANDSLCYSNKDEESPFYKCAKVKINDVECTSCVKNYYLGTEDKKCSKINDCAESEDEDTCVKCRKGFDLDEKSGKCIKNDKSDDDENN